MMTPEEIKQLLMTCLVLGMNPREQHEAMRAGLEYIGELETRLYEVEQRFQAYVATEEAFTSQMKQTVQEFSSLPSRWISVEERLPEDGLAIVCCPDPDRPVYIAWMCNGRWLNQFSRPLGLPVTHWMPLPKPPEEGET